MLSITVTRRCASVSNRNLAFSNFLIAQQNLYAVACLSPGVTSDGGGAWERSASAGSASSVGPTSVGPEEKAFAACKTFHPSFPPLGSLPGLIPKR